MSAFSSPRNGGQVSLPSDNWGGLPSAHGMYNISSLGSGNLGRGAGDNNFWFAFW
jgi:RNA-binding protein Musashi